MELGSHLGPHRAERMSHVSGLDLNLIHIHLQLLYNEPYLETTNTKLNFNLLKPTGRLMHHQFNIQELYALPTLYLIVLCLSENKQRLVPLTA
jgi:hypothetical protein